MTRIDFYILNQTQDSARLDFAVKLCEKALQRDNTVVIQTQSQADTSFISKQLWEKKAESFLPHHLTCDAQSAHLHSPIIIGHDITQTTNRDILINLAQSRPAVFSQFNRLIEVVYQEPKSLKASRENYSFFKERGYDIQVHKL